MQNNVWPSRAGASTYCSHSSDENIEAPGAPQPHVRLAGALGSAFPAGWGLRRRTRRSPPHPPGRDGCRVGPSGACRQSDAPGRPPGSARCSNALALREAFNRLPALGLCGYLRPRAAAKDNLPLLF